MKPNIKKIKSTNRQIDKWRRRLFFFDEKNIFLNLKKKKKNAQPEQNAQFTILSNNTIGSRPKELFFEALKLENQILNLSISERKFGMIWNC